MTEPIETAPGEDLDKFAPGLRLSLESDADFRARIMEALRITEDTLPPVARSFLTAYLAQCMAENMAFDILSTNRKLGRIIASALATALERRWE